VKLVTLVTVATGVTEVTDIQGQLFSKRIKSFCGAQPPQRLGWTDAWRDGSVGGYGDFTEGTGCARR